MVCFEIDQRKGTEFDLFFGFLGFQIAMVYDKVSGKPRGYAFVEYEHERDMQCKFS